MVVEAALSQIDRQFGKGSIMRLGDEGRAPVEVIPTGSLGPTAATACWLRSASCRSGAPTATVRATV